MAQKKKGSRKKSSKTKIATLHLAEDVHLALDLLAKIRGVDKATVVSDLVMAACHKEGLASIIKRNRNASSRRNKAEEGVAVSEGNDEASEVVSDSIEAHALDESASLNASFPN